MSVDGTKWLTIPIASCLNSVDTKNIRPPHTERSCLMVKCSLVPIVPLFNSVHRQTCPHTEMKRIRQPHIERHWLMIKNPRVPIVSSLKFVHRQTCPHTEKKESDHHILTENAWKI